METSQPSKGYPLSIGMLIVMLLELAILIDIEGELMNDVLTAVFVGMGALCAVQFVGILLVANGRYRLGGILQFVASAPHIIDLFGFLGIFGAITAYRYPDRLDEIDDEEADGP